ncbi:ARM repeat-containing protein [Gigaspora margarita]|uniref:ARM repeat-containing protein n=1 Tax=Gigaspora margarita TaxID=4874 RepID=A0A8H3XD27_GIGMA|nr:ARM repeat-containing protein [Gigaspora margarita]
MEQQQFINGLEELLTQLVSSDTDTARIRTATSTLNNEYYNSASCVPAYVHILSSSPSWQVRQLAAVELRKRGPKWWSKIDANSQSAIKSRLLEIILQEPENIVRHATARVISSIGKIEIPAGNWNDLPQFLYQCCKSQNSGQREVGIFVLFTLMEVIEDVFADSLLQLLQLFGDALNDPESQAVRVITMQALGRVAEFIEPDKKEEIQIFRNLIPPMVNILIQCLKDGDNDSTIKGFELFETLLMMDAPLLSNHLPQLIEFALTVARNIEYDESVRIIALQFLIWVATYKKAKIQRLKLIGPIIQELMPIGTEDDPEDIHEESPSRMSFRVINSFAMKLPPQQVFPIAMDFITTYVQNSNPKFRKAGMMALAVLIEGCADYMRPKFNDLLPIICTGLRDPEIIVRRGACLALSCLAEELDQEVATNHATLLPLLFELTNDTSTEIVKQACNALDLILEGLGDDILQYLPALMERLLILMDNGANEIKDTVIAAIGSAAHASGEEFKPYFQGVIDRLRILMTLSQTDEDIILRGVATDTVGAIAEAVGKEMIKPYVDDIMRLAIEGLHKDSTRLRECSYCLFAVLSRVFKEEFASYLSTIMPQLIKSCQMEEHTLSVEAEEDLSCDLDIDDEEDTEITIGSAVIDEKEIAAEAIGEIFENTRSHFLPYVESTLKELIELSNHHSESVRKVVVGSLFSFLATFYSMSNPVKWEPGLPVKVLIHENVYNMAKAVLSTVLTMWEDEESKLVVIQICSELADTIKICGPAIIADSVRPIAENVLLLYQKKAVCQQDNDDDEGLLDDDEEAEYDSLLINNASDLVAVMALVLGYDFVPYFKEYIHYITKYYKKTKPTSERSMAIGCLGEITIGLKDGISEFTDQLLPLYLKALADEDEEVRSNAAFAVGLVCQHTRLDISSQYGDILSKLHPLFTGQSLSNATDNACGAVCRMIMTCPQAVPMEQVLEVLLRTLPIKRDFEENEPVFKCICALFRTNNSFVFNHIHDFLNIFAKVLSPPEDQLKDHTRQELIELIQALNQQFPDAVLRSSLGELIQF